MKYGLDYSTLDNASSDVPVWVEQQAYENAYDYSKIRKQQNPQGWQPFNFQVFRKSDVQRNGVPNDGYRFTVGGPALRPEFPYHRLSDYRQFPV